MCLSSIVGGNIKAQQQKVPFQTMRGYFLKNNIDANRFSMKKILSKTELDSFFGMAAFMGAEGKPSTVDFSKQFIIPVVIEKTNKDITLEPVSLKIERAKKLKFHFRMSVGNVTTAESTPILLISINRRYKSYDILLKRSTVLK